MQAQQRSTSHNLTGQQAKHTIALSSNPVTRPRSQPDLLQRDFGYALATCNSLGRGIYLQAIMASFQMALRLGITG